MPWTNPDDLREPFETWGSAYKRLLRIRSVLREPASQNNFARADSVEQEDYEELLPRQIQTEWMHLAKALPNAPIVAVDLGAKDFNEQHQ